MAQTIWTNGAATGDLNTAGNWSNGVPTDTTPAPAIWDQTNSDDVTASMAALAALLLPEVMVNEGYTGDIGTSGSPFEVSATKFTFRGTGKLFLKQGSTSDTADLILDAPSSPLMQIGANTALFAKISALNGRVTLDSTLTGTTDLFVGAGAIVNIEGANAITGVYVQTGGQIVACNVPITTLYMMGGSMMQNRDGGTITTVIMGGDARLDYQAATAPTTVTVGGSAVLDFTKDGREKTVASARVFQGGRIKKSHGLIITAGDSYLDGLTGLN